MPDWLWWIIALGFGLVVGDAVRGLWRFHRSGR